VLPLHGRSVAGGEHPQRAALRGVPRGGERVGGGGARAGVAHLPQQAARQHLAPRGAQAGGLLEARGGDPLGAHPRRAGPRALPALRARERRAPVPDVPRARAEHEEGVPVLVAPHGVVHLVPPRRNAALGARRGRRAPALVVRAEDRHPPRAGERRARPAGDLPQPAGLDGLHRMPLL
ncbi:MAG: hypothetical protein AVDCRST_MAG68-2459, partial [uncultured Gemmatimonadetes bacterium]